MSIQALNYKIENIDSLENGKLLIRFYDKEVVDYKPVYLIMSSSIDYSSSFLII